jgi:hypothetical protein
LEGSRGLRDAQIKEKKTETFESDMAEVSQNVKEKKKGGEVRGGRSSKEVIVTHQRICENVIVVA